MIALEVCEIWMLTKRLCDERAKLLLSGSQLFLAFALSKEIRQNMQSWGQVAG